MPGTPPPAVSETSGESVLADLIEALGERLGRGEAVDVDAVCRQHPAHADELRELLPTLQALASFEKPDRGTFDGSAHADGKCPSEAPGADCLPFVTLGDFRVIREIGRGGMGVVYEAEQLSLGRRVALKVLRFGELLDPRGLARFQTEAQAAAMLHHANIVPVYAVGSERGVHYYAMQLIDGISLAEAIDGSRARDARTENEGQSCVAAKTAARPTVPANRFPIGAEYHRLVARLGIQAAEALEFAHERGILHRDVKPSNLLLDCSGRLWLADFGLARVGRDSTLTVTGDVLGTLRYLSPEAISGDPQRSAVDRRSDVYSLGATLYELLTLTAVFPGDDRTLLLRRIVEDAPPPPRAIDRTVPPELETILLKALEKDPAARYGTAGELAADLRRFLDDRPIAARRPSVWDRAVKWSRRHRPIVASMIVVLWLTSIGSILTAWRIVQERSQTEIERAKAVEQARLATEQMRLAEERLLALRWGEYVTHIDRAGSGWRHSNFLSAEEHLAACEPIAGDEDLRGFEWRLLAGWVRTKPKVWARHEEGARCVRFSPDGVFVAAAGTSGVRIWTWPAGNLAAEFTVPRAPDRDSREAAGVSSIDWSPDGSYLATAGDDGTVRIRETGSWRELVRLPHEGRVAAASFSPDGGLLASVAHESTSSVVRIRPTDPWRPAATVESLVADARPVATFYANDVPKALAWAPDGTLLALAGSAGVVVWDVVEQSERFRLPHPSPVNSVAFSPKQDVLITACSEGRVRAFTRSTGGFLEELKRGHGAAVESIAFARDSETFVTAGRDGRLLTWEWGRAPTAAFCVFTLRTTGPLAGTAFHPEGLNFVSCSLDGTIHCWDRSVSQEYVRVLGDAEAGDMRPAFSRSGLVAVRLGRDLHVVDAAGGRRIAAVSCQEYDVRFATFDTDSNSLVGLTVAGELVRCGPADWSWKRLASFPRLGSAWVTAGPGDGTLAAVTTEGTVVLVKADGASLAAVPDLHDIERLSFSPEARHVAAFGAEGLRVFEWPARAVVVNSERKCIHCAWSAAGDTFAASFMDGKVQIYDTRTWHLAREFLADAKALQSIALSADGWTLAGSTTGSGEVNLWNVATGRVLLPLDVHMSRTQEVAFSPDATTLIAAGRESGMRNRPELLLWKIASPTAQMRE